MKQFALLVIVIVVVLGGAVAGFTFWRNSQIQRESPTGACDIEPAALRDKLAKLAGVNLPASASDFHACENTQAGLSLAARFDVPAAELTAWLAGSEKLGKAVEGKAAEELHEEMQYCSTWVSRPWWEVTELAQPACGQSEGTRPAAGGAAKWRLRTCMVKAPEDKMRVYLLYIDDLGGGTAAALPTTQPQK